MFLLDILIAISWSHCGTVTILNKLILLWKREILLQVLQT